MGSGAPVDFLWAGSDYLPVHSHHQGDCGLTAHFRYLDVKHLKLPIDFRTISCYNLCESEGDEDEQEEQKEHPQNLD